MPRAIWKGAIAFSLVHIPVTLYPATRAAELDFNLLDRRDFSAVGYQRINKRTGQPVPSQEIVKGYEYEDDQYVVLTGEDFRQANVKATQTVDIFGFTDVQRIPPYFYDTPYYLEPTKRGGKGYALLREVLRRKHRVALANVVVRTRQYLAAVVPVGPMLVLNTLRFAEEIRAMNEFTLPEDDLDALGVSDRELSMAERLVDDMAESWRPEQYHDTYREDLMHLIERKVQSGETHVVAEPERQAAAEAGAEIVDLMALLKRSLAARGGREKDDEDQTELPTPDDHREEEDDVPPQQEKPTRKASGRNGASHGGKRSARSSGGPQVPRRRHS